MLFLADENFPGLALRWLREEEKVSATTSGEDSRLPNFGG
jgi:hypothetical protein